MRPEREKPLPEYHSDSRGCLPREIPPSAESYSAKDGPLEGHGGPEPPLGGGPERGRGARNTKERGEVYS